MSSRGLQRRGGGGDAPAFSARQLLSRMSVAGRVGPMSRVGANQQQLGDRRAAGAGSPSVAKGLGGAHPLSTRGIYNRPASLRAALAKMLATAVVVAALFMMLTALQAWLAPGVADNGASADQGTGEDMDPEELGKRRGSTVGSALLSFLRAVVVIVGLLVVLHHAGVRTTTLFALASILSLVIGLAAQSALADHFAGLIFLAEGQLHIGDFVHLVMGTSGSSGSHGGSAAPPASPGTLSGTVQDVTLRRVRLSTFDNETIYVPNSRIVAVVNASQQFPIVRLRIRLAANADIDAAARILEDECRSIRRDAELSPLLPALSPDAPAAEMRLVRALDAAGMKTPGPEVLGVSEVAGSDYEVGIRFMARVNKQWAASRIVRRRLLARMQLEGLAGVPQIVSVGAGAVPGGDAAVAAAGFLPLR